MRWPKTIGPTVTATTTDVQLGGKSVLVPAKAQTLLAVCPHVSSPAGNTAGQSIAAKFTLKSNDIPVIPYIVLAAPIGSSLLKSVAQFKDIDPWYPVNCPVKGGNSIDCYVTGLQSHTIEVYGSMDLLFADYPAGPQIHAKVGSFTNTGTSPGETHDATTLRITNGHLIKQLAGYCVGTTVAALKGICGNFRLSSSNFGTQKLNLPNMGDILFGINGASGQVDTNIQECELLTRLGDQIPLDIPIEDPCDIDIYFNLGVGLTTLANFIAGILYA